MGSRIASGLVKRSIALTAFAAWIGSAAAQVTSHVSFDASGVLPNQDAYEPEISADGRYVGFFWYDALIHSDTFLFDRMTGAIERLSVNSSEVGGNSFSYSPALTPDVRYAAFWSFATNLVPGDTNGPYPIGEDVFVRDRVSGTTERVSISSFGAQADDASYHPAISADGRYVAFTSQATNLVVGDSNDVEDLFVRDRVVGATVRVSVDPSGAQANGASSTSSITADGRYLAFQSTATNLVAGDTNGSMDVFVRDLTNGITERMSVDSSGGEGNAGSSGADISTDGRYVAFRSSASNLVPGDTNGKSDVFIRDRLMGTIERVSVSSTGLEANGDSAAPDLTADGIFVAFQSTATNLVVGDTNGRLDVFVHNRRLGTTLRVSVDSNGVQGNADSIASSLSRDGRYVAFVSRARFAATDANSIQDIYVRDRRYEPLTNLCAPGTVGVIACPCSNPPSGPGRGCDNAFGTGGAILSASGVAYLSTDSLVLTTSAQTPTGLTIVLQGDAVLGSGALFGQGVRCVGGALTRLYMKLASGGSITAPDSSAGDPTISTRSASLGDPIQPGESRWYLVYYRDALPLGGCPASSAFNSTQTGLVVWLP